MLTGDSMDYNNNQQFSTKDRDNDDSSGHCAVDRRSGWWHVACTLANLNAQYYESEQENNVAAIYWSRWRHLDSMKRVEMKIKLN